MRTCRFATLAILVASLLLATPASANPFPVRFHRPVKTGDEFLLTVSYVRTEDGQATLGRRTRTNDARNSARLSGRARVLAVAPEGLPTELRIVIDDGEVCPSGKPTEKLESGQVLVARWHDGKLRVSRLEENISADAAAILALALELKSTDLRADTDDDLFGTPDRRRVGDSWPVNTQRCAKSLRKIAPTLADNEVTGTVTLDAYGKLRGIPSLKLSTVVDCNRLIPSAIPAGILPANAKITDGSMHATSTGFYPLDVNDPHVRLAESIRCTFNTEVPSNNSRGRTVNILAVVHVKHSINLDPVPPAAPPAPAVGDAR
jgi:hypothetical protein